MTLSKSFTVPKIRVFQAADDEDLVILACVSFSLIHPCYKYVTDGWTNIQKICNG